MKERKKILILGAGPVGLIAGWLLSKKNWEVKIFEIGKIVDGKKKQIFGQKFEIVK